MRFLAFIALLVFFAAPASAETYRWYLGYDEPGYRYGTPSAACQAADDKNWQGYVDNGAASYYQRLGHRLVFISETRYYCYTIVKSSYNPDPRESLYQIGRAGNSCEEGQDYDSSTGLCKGAFADKGRVCESGGGRNGMDKVYNSQGQCVSLEEADTPATCKYLSGKGTVSTRIFVTYDDDGQPNQVPINKMGCVANAISLAKCKQPVAVAKDGISIEHGGSNCTVDVSFTGEPFEKGSTTPYPIGDPAQGKEGMCENANCVVPDAPTVTDSKPCNYMSNGQVVGCETTQFQGNPGEMNCGTVNGGAYTCTARPATSTGSSVKTEIKTTPSTDGGSTVTKDDVHTEVKCTAPGSCTTTVTKTTNVTIKDGAGNTTSSTTNCTGSKCASSTNPDANGDGLGDCVKNCSEEEEGGEFVGPTIGETKTVGESTQAFVNAVKGGPLMSAVSNIRVPTGGTCHFGSADIGFTTINFDSMCDLWAGVSSVLSAIFLAIWALIAVRIVMSA